MVSRYHGNQQKNTSSYLICFLPFTLHRVRLEPANPNRLTTLQSYNPSALQPYSLTTLQLYNLIALQPYSVTTLQPYNLTALQPYSLTTLQPYNPQGGYLSQYLLVMCPWPLQTPTPLYNLVPRAFLRRGEDGREKVETCLALSYIL